MTGARKENQLPMRRDLAKESLSLERTGETIGSRRRESGPARAVQQQHARRIVAAARKPGAEFLSIARSDAVVFELSP